MDAIRLARGIDLPRGIVWEALVDPVLVAGWLHPVERIVTGTAPVLFHEPETPAVPAVLEVISPAFGRLRITLDELPGGVHGTRTALTLEVVDDAAPSSERERLWALRLDQLDALLRGHPVDWRTWAREHRELLLI